MHGRKFFVQLLAANFLVLILAGTVAAQDSGEIPDINPVDVQIERKPDSGPARFSGFPERGPGLPSTDHVADSDADQESIFNNQLRANSNGSLESVSPEPRQMEPPEPQRFQSDFDAQPTPPQPRHAFNSNETLTKNAVDPLQELDPNRQMPMFEPQHSEDVDSATFNQPVNPPQRSFEQQLPAAQSPSMPQSFRANAIPDSYSMEPTAVNPTGFQQLKDSPSGNTNPNLQNTKSLLANYEISMAPQPLPGIPVSLEDLLRTTPLESRMSLVQQYWETWFDWATLQNNTTYSQWLHQLPNPRSGPEQLLLRTARSMADNEILAAEIQLSRSQSKLQQLARWNGQDLLPLPLNQPLVSKYITHYEWYAQRQRLPAKLKGIDAMLPRSFELLSDRADTTFQAEQARNQSQQAFSAGQLGIGDLLEAGRSWRSSLQGFVGSAVSYNQAISDYALTITPAQKPLEQIVSMLIAKPESVAETAQRQTILQRTTQPQQQLPTSRVLNDAGTSPMARQQPFAREEQPSQPAFRDQQTQPQRNDSNSFNSSGGSFGGK